MENILTVVGEHIKDFRMLKRLSRRALGELVGISGQAIWKIETGRSDPRLTNLNKIAAALNLQTAALILGHSRTLAEVSVEEMDAIMANMVYLNEQHLNNLADERQRLEALLAKHHS